MNLLVFEQASELIVNAVDFLLILRSFADEIRVTQQRDAATAISSSVHARHSVIARIHNDIATAVGPVRSSESCTCSRSSHTPTRWRDRLAIVIALVLIDDITLIACH